MAVSTRHTWVDSQRRCPYASRGPRRLWSRWPLRATRASVSWHASASHYSSAVRACLGPYRARAPSEIVQQHVHMHRLGLNGTRRFGTGHRREPYSSNTASWADVSGHNTLKIGRGEPRRSKGGNPYPTSSKAIGSRDTADVPHRERRGSAGPFLTTAQGVHATHMGGFPASLPLCVARP